VKGTLAGLTGLITKPLTGIIFAASKTIEGISSSATYLDSKLFEDK
jgi:vacuolar protein sorting-associated protein 13A/C